MKQKVLVCWIALCLLVACPLGVSATASAETVQTQAAGETVAEAEVHASASQTPVSDRVVQFVGDHLSELFCMLAFVGSVLLAAVYKKGLLPLLRTGLSKVAGSLGEGIDSIQRTADALASRTDSSVGGLVERVEPMLDAARRAADHAQTLAIRLEALEAELSSAIEERQAAAVLLRGQLEMLYEFCMAVNLPQYQKDRLGQTYVRLIGAAEGEGDHA